MEKEEYFASQDKNKDANSEIMSKFSAEIIQLRDAMLKQLEPFDTPEKIKKLKKLVDASSDTLRKLAGLAARIQIIRNRLTELASFRLGKALPKKPKVKEIKESSKIEEETINPNDKSNWISVRTVKQGDINGVDLDEGIKIKVSPNDVERLKKAGLVEIVSTDKEKAQDKSNVKEDKSKEDGKKAKPNETEGKKEENNPKDEKNSEQINTENKEKDQDKLLSKENIGEHKEVDTKEKKPED
tara:strand:+ start:588 stop:1313 length:726 start_codon:yes stop_codon:yes gene_type:complete